MPAAGLGEKAGASAHVPFDADATVGTIDHLDVDAGVRGHHIGGKTEMRDAMLALDRVVGLAAVDPVAIHADAHAAAPSGGTHSGV